MDNRLSELARPQQGRIGDMVRGPYDLEEAQPPGGAAAERLRELLEQRFPEGVPPGSPLPEDLQEAIREREPGEAQVEDRDVTGTDTQPCP
jgi:hypothetical protein